MRDPSGSSVPGSREWPRLSHLVDKVFVVALDVSGEDPLLEALRQSPLFTWFPRRSLALVRSFAALSFASAGLLVAACGHALLGSLAQGVAGSVLGFWTFVYMLLQAAVLPSRACLTIVPHGVVDLAPAPPTVAVLTAKVASFSAELLYGWLLIGVLVRSAADPCIAYPWLRALQGWILVLTFMRAACVDLFQLTIRPPSTRRRLRHLWAPEDDEEVEEQEQLEASARAGRRRSAFLTEVKHNGKKNDAVVGSLNSGCAICLVDFQEGSTVVRMPCHHGFHGACIKTWLQKSARCPLCMQSCEEI